MFIIGLSGRKQSGKDTVCAMIQAMIPNVERLAFADELKAEVCQALDITLEDIEADKPRFRGILQWWGTEWRRKLDDRYWLRMLENRVNIARAIEGSAGVIVTDCRFPNEADLVREMGGVVIRVERPGLDTSDTHSSETAMDGYEGFYMGILNDGGLGELQAKVERLVNELRDQEFIQDRVRFTRNHADAVVAQFMAPPDRPIASHGLAVAGQPVD